LPVSEGVEGDRQAISGEPCPVPVLLPGDIGEAPGAVPWASVLEGRSHLASANAHMWPSRLELVARLLRCNHSWFEVSFVLPHAGLGC